MNRDSANTKWVLCPVCGNKTRTKVYEDTVSRCTAQNAKQKSGSIFHN